MRLLLKKYSLAPFHKLTEKHEFNESVYGEHGTDFYF